MRISCGVVAGRYSPAGSQFGASWCPYARYWKLWVLLFRGNPARKSLEMRKNRTLTKHSPGYATCARVPCSNPMCLKGAAFKEAGKTSISGRQDTLHQARILIVDD